MFICSSAAAQHKEFSTLKSDSVIQQFDSLYNSADSLSIFRLLDSLLQMPDNLKETSQFAIRLGYNSNVVALSRTIGFNQFGLAPGISYYHSSGLYADAAAYWSQQYCPSVYLSVLSGGYLKTVNTHWSFLADYSHYFYSASDSATYNPYTNNVGISNYIDVKPVTFRLDYYFYFGQKTAHRIMPGIFFTLQKRNWLGLDRITLYPSFNLLLGSENDVIHNIVSPNANQSLGSNNPLYYTVTKTEFGIMNYSFTAPLSIALKGWNVLISYTYNIPKPLPHEDVSLQNGGYFSCSITRYISFGGQTSIGPSRKLNYFPMR